MWRVAILALLPVAALADSLVATRTIRAQAVIGADDVALVEAEIPGALADPAAALGREARTALYPGRPIRAEDLGPPAVVDRNQIIALVFASGGLSIVTEGRAMERGAVGDVIRVMNLASRTTVSGRIGPDGAVSVGPNP